MDISIILTMLVFIALYLYKEAKFIENFVSQLNIKYLSPLLNKKSNLPDIYTTNLKLPCYKKHKNAKLKCLVNEHLQRKCFWTCN